MKTILSLFIILLLINSNSNLETVNYPKAKVSYSDFENLVNEVKAHRKKRLINLNAFIEKSKGRNTIILDTRSKEMYDKKHLKGAVHLNFSDFTQANLNRIIPNIETSVLIYCNNNFHGDDIYFATKMVLPKTIDNSTKPLTLALNIPTYINLYGYGYKNVYELSELITPFDRRIAYAGSTINQKL
ncbi:rhodanese-like domain-containing protein [uncultured Algibacter sp.]|uniref:rhodanese-like domain-containing protein n=1 Tax=uncultured Algibacter sp. TaxID=298659 RepID=UPI003217C4F7